jgi:transcriptional regulator with XRE-family HTH domain
MDDSKPSPLTRTLARNVLACRSSRGWSLDDVAARSRLRAALLARIEAGQEPVVRLGVLEHLARALEVDISRLLRE